MPLEDVEKIIRQEPLENYYDVGNELGRYVTEREHFVHLVLLLSSCKKQSFQFFFVIVLSAD